MIDSKSWWQSKTVWGGIIALLAGVLGLFGYNLVEADQAQLVEIGSGAAVVVGSLIAIVGRVRASKVVGKSE